MRHFVLTIALLAFNQALAEDAYIIVDAYALPLTERQPTWIAVGYGDLKTHVPTGKTVSTIPAGIYTLDHIDFDESAVESDRTLYYRLGQSPIRFEAAPETITFVGMIQIDHRLPRKGSAPKVTIGPLKVMLEWMCDSHPELLDRYPVRVVGSGDPPKGVKVRCKN